MKVTLKILFFLLSNIIFAGTITNPIIINSNNSKGINYKTKGGGGKIYNEKVIINKTINSKSTNNTKNFNASANVKTNVNGIQKFIIDILNIKN